MKLNIKKNKGIIIGITICVIIIVLVISFILNKNTAQVLAKKSIQGKAPTAEVEDKDDKDDEIIVFIEEDETNEESEENEENEENEDSIDEAVEKEEKAKETNSKLEIQKKENSSVPINNGVPYYIIVNYTSNVVTIYGKDNNNQYTVPVKAMVCSVGTATPKSGVYKLTNARYRWRALFGGVYGQYAVPIVGNILFHSVPYQRKDNSTLEYWEYDKLGTFASAGCIRLTVEDALWIYNNCGSGTKVEFSSNSADPLGKPTAQKISGNVNLRGYDPTDPATDNPWKNANNFKVDEKPESSIMQIITPVDKPTIEITPETSNNNTTSEEPKKNEEKIPDNNKEVESKEDKEDIIKEDDNNKTEDNEDTNLDTLEN